MYITTPAFIFGVYLYARSVAVDSAPLYSTSLPETLYSSLELKNTAGSISRSLISFSAFVSFATVMITLFPERTPLYLPECFLLNLSNLA